MANLSVSSGKDGLIQRTMFLTFGDSTDHTADYPLNDVVASLNRWVQTVAAWIWQASGTWEYDDTNYSTLPWATTTLVNSQSDYALPNTVFQIKRVEVKDSGGIYFALKQIDETEIEGSLTEWRKTAGFPTHYDVIANSLILYPPPSTSQVTASEGLKIWITREVNTFTVPASYTTADTTQPGFDESFHDILPHAAAYDWLEANGSADKAKRYWEQVTNMKNLLETHYGMKNAAKRAQVAPRIERYT